MFGPSDVRFPTRRAGTTTNDFVNSDRADLAVHMARCAQARGVLFGFKNKFHQGSHALSGHLVTVAFVGLSLVAAASMLM